MLVIWLAYKYSVVKLPSPVKSPDSMLVIWLEYKSSVVKLPSPVKSPDSMLVIWLSSKSRYVKLPSPVKSPDSMLVIWLESKFRVVKLPSPVKSPDSMLVIWLQSKSRSSSCPARVKSPDSMLVIWLSSKSSVVKLPSPLKSPDSMLVIWLESKSSVVKLPSPREVARFDARDLVAVQIQGCGRCCRPIVVADAREAVDGCARRSRRCRHDVAGGPAWLVAHSPKVIARASVAGITSSAQERRQRYGLPDVSSDPCLHDTPPVLKSGLEPSLAWDPFSAKTRALSIIFRQKSPAIEGAK